MIVYSAFLVAYFAAFVIIHSALLLLAARELRRYKARASASSLRHTLRSPLAPAVSVLVPAFNEASGIADSVRSLLALDYPRLEVVVINDGSSDATLERLTEVFEL